MYCLFACFEVKRPSQQFFSYAGTELPLPGFKPVLWGVNVSCSRTKHGAARAYVLINKMGYG